MELFFILKRPILYSQSLFSVDRKKASWNLISQSPFFLFILVPSFRIETEPQILLDQKAARNILKKYIRSYFI